MCVHIKDPISKAVMDSKNIMWFCDVCSTELSGGGSCIAGLTNKCRELQRKLEEKDADLNVELRNLKAEINDKDTKYNDELNEKIKINAHVTELTAKVDVLTKQKSAVDTQLQSCNNELSITKKKLEELDQLRISLLSSIETLTVQDTLHLAEIKKLKNELANGIINTELTNSSTRTINNIYNKPTSTSMKKHQILLFGNESCMRGTGAIVKFMCKNKFDINCQYSSSLRTMEELLTDYASLSQRLTKNDYIIMSTGIVDSLRGKLASTSCWTMLSEISTKSNLIIITPPFANNRKILNNFIFNFNMDIRQQTVGNKVDCQLVNTDSFMSPSDRNHLAHIPYEVKIRIFKHICNDLITTKLNTEMNFRKAATSPKIG